MPAKYPDIAIVYDFDGTLAPGNVQEVEFIPKVGMNSKEFWDEVKALAKENDADETLMYMYYMLKKSKDANQSIKREAFKAHGESIIFYDGVLEWFDRINQYGKDCNVLIHHFIISSANKEIIEGTKIASKFERIFASCFLYDTDGIAIWPAAAVNFTTKTQFLFRINKGSYDLSDSSMINEYVKMEERAIPFANMIYIGDGKNDVPCFRVVKDLGGMSIAVYKPNANNAKTKADKFIVDDRVHLTAPAKYTQDSKLDKVVKAQIELISARTKVSKHLSKS